MVKGKKMQESTELIKAPNIFYQKFFARFNEIDSVPLGKWETVHVISYFCRLYKQHYKIDYSFKFNKSPSKCYEAFQIRRLEGMMNSTHPAVLKEYIDWIFAKKVVLAKRRITVIGFLATQDFVSEFKFNQQKSKEITRTTYLPPKLMQVLEDLNMNNIKTYGDLAFMKQAMDLEDDFAKENYPKAFTKLEEVGFDIGCLEQVR